MTQTLALRLYGKDDLRLEAFELPEIADDEILADVHTDSICMSTYKLFKQGQDHKRVPPNLAEHPVIVGHELAGTILKVGSRHRDLVAEGAKYTVQPAMNYPGREFESPGYSFHYFGGNATKVIIPREIMECECFLPYAGEGFFPASLAEPISCIIGGFNVQYHFTYGSYEHKMGIAENGALALLGGTGPMGLCAIDYALHGPRNPRLLAVTDVDAGRLARAEALFPPEAARTKGIELRFVNTGTGNPAADLKDITGGKGYDDVFVLAPVPALVEQASRIMGYNGCMNFFAGPSDPDFMASMNFYDVHYHDHHVAANSGGDTNDMRQALELMANGALNPAVMLTHIGGIDSAADTIKNLPNIGGGKKMIYTQLEFPLTALEEFGEKGKSDPLFRELAEITARHDGLWSVEAEEYLLAKAPRVGETG